MKTLQRVLLVDPLGVVRAGLAAVVQRSAPQAIIEEVGMAIVRRRQRSSVTVAA